MSGAVLFLASLVACRDGARDDGPLPAPIAGTAVDTGPPAEVVPGFDDTRVLVVPHADGLSLVAGDGTLAWSRTWTELVGACDGCGGEGSSADGDGLLLSFTTPGRWSGAVARIDGAGGLDFRVDGFVFPHDAVRDPADDTILVPEATANRITWIAGDGRSSDPVRTLSAATSDDFDGNTPNGVDRFDREGRSLLVASHRGGRTDDAGSPGAEVPSGEVTLWDISLPDAPARLWRFPETGALDTPHGAVFREHAGRWWLLYAHSDGLADGSSVGLAVTDDPTVAPAYVADLVPEAPIGPFAFLRGVELTPEGWLYLTDSGSGGLVGPGAEGRIVRAPMPGLEPGGAVGAIGGGQVFVPLVGAELVLDGLRNPFEGWLWQPVTPF